MPLTFDEFPVPTLDEWRKVAEASLKGKPFDTLITETIEGIDLRPLYDANHIELLTQRLAMPGADSAARAGRRFSGRRPVRTRRPS